MREGREGKWEQSIELHGIRVGMGVIRLLLQLVVGRNDKSVQLQNKKGNRADLPTINGFMDHDDGTNIIQYGFFFHPFTTAIGRSLTHFLLIPAAWHASTTSVTSL